MRDMKTAVAATTLAGIAAASDKPSAGSRLPGLASLSHWIDIALAGKYQH
ncbi:MAG: hypothetical protein N3B14_03390 [Thermoleophilia bacterium]|nr:hypothetical protein [Thermoleophilia bacterium]